MYLKNIADFLWWGNLSQAYGD